MRRAKCAFRCRGPKSEVRAQRLFRTGFSFEHIKETSRLRVEYFAFVKGQNLSLKFNSVKFKLLSFFAVQVHKQHKRPDNTKVTFATAHNSTKIT